jgi:hypothetical protein
VPVEKDLGRHSLSGRISLLKKLSGKCLSAIPLWRWLFIDTSRPRRRPKDFVHLSLRTGQRADLAQGCVFLAMNGNEATSTTGERRCGLSHSYAILRKKITLLRSSV